MIKEKTVFVFGAGSNLDYQFPTGAQLRDEIASVCNWDTMRPDIPEHIKILNNMDFNMQVLTNFRTQLMNGGFDTIDEFLEARENPVYRSLGKTAIAIALIKHEHPQIFQGRFSTDSFYNFLFKKMANEATKENFHQNKVSFVTYNYDRSFEYFLSNSLLNRYEGIQDSEVDYIMSQMKIIHVHGSLGNMRWHGYNKREYNTVVDQNNVKIASEGIVNFNEVDGNYEGYKEARKEFHEAKNVVFVGFGFHPLNLSRLAEGDCLLGKKRLFATSLGLTEEEISEIFRIAKTSMVMYPKNAIPFAKDHLTWL